ncbi:MAG: acetyl-CoA hydrolase/transferase family protein [Firmicutes bacterium]|nr:acetyl-CoA hydrolase/transferase family protein [Bacillota bacterium]
MDAKLTEYYKSRTISITDAAKMVKSGDIVGTALGPGIASQELINAILDRWEELENVQWYDAVQMTPHRLWDLEFARKAYGHINYVPGFIGVPIRKVGEARLADYVPQVGWQAPHVAAARLSVLVRQVAPPNKNGYINLGLDNFYTTCVLREGRQNGRCRLAIAEVNENMPIVFGDNWVHVSEFDYFIEHTTPISEYPMRPEPTVTEKTIGALISDMIKDGDCIQMGIGGITEAILAGLEGKRHLGIHTEMVPPSLLDLVNKGIVDNSKKVNHTGATTATFCAGDKALYDYVNENPAVGIYPSTITNSPIYIGQNPNTVAINQALQIDFTGQISVESMGSRQISGSGGQPDFQMGALWSDGGRAFTVLRAATKKKDGTLVSNIVPAFEPGTIASVPRYLADYIVTEYGIAHLKYKSMRERFEALVEVAHPDLRGELREAAKKTLYP